MAKRVTIKDIAAAAGITPQAVSRALRGESDISEKTRLRVREIAEKLNYVGNSSARALRYGTSRMIAVVYDNPVNLYFSFMTAYLHECLKARGYSMLMMVEPVRRLSADLYLSVLSGNVDGILSFLEPDEEAGKLIDDYGVPVVLVGRRSDVRNVDCIYTDDEKGGRLAAAYLAETGARKIAYFSEGLDLTCAQDRFRGFRAELSRRGLFDESLCFFSEPEEGGPAERLKRFLDSGKEFDGLFCFSDFFAYEAVCLFAKRGIAVPVVGYDDVREKIPIPGAIPSVGSDKRRIAETSVGFLLDRIPGAGENAGGREAINARRAKREKCFDVRLCLPGKTD